MPDSHTQKPDGFLSLLELSGNRLLHSSDLNSYLQWVAEVGPLLAPDLVQMADQTPPRELFRALGIAIYNAMPLPANNFQLRPAPAPGRNDPCPCGSGRKYKHCCSGNPLADLLKNVNCLIYVLNAIPQKQLSELVHSKIDTQALADVAEQWLEEGKEKRVAALLEPWFKAGVELNQRQVPLLDILADLYLAGNNPVKRQRLLLRVSESHNKELRCDAFQRLATISMDKGDSLGAWNYFLKAQQAFPDSPSLSLLELTLLCALGKIQQAKDRAAFWLVKLRRSRDVNPEVLNLLEQCKTDPSVLLNAMYSPGYDIDGLIELIAENHALEIHYQLDGCDGEYQLKADKALTKIEQQWIKLTNQQKPMLTNNFDNDATLLESINEWLPFLRKNPLLLNSFYVLDDLVIALQEIANPYIFREVILPISERAEQLLNSVLAVQAPKEAFTLPWSMMDNRPLLRLLSEKIGFLIHGDRDGPESICLLEKMLRLNPNDNHGYREILSTAYIATNQPEKAIKLAQAYPDDMLCSGSINTVLALYMMDRKGEALAHLASIAERNKTILKMLIQPNVKKPSMSGYGISIGGKDQAWLYREDNLPLWKKHEALDWLSDALKSLGIK